MTKPINQFQRNRLITSTDKYYSLDSEDDVCSGCPPTPRRKLKESSYQMIYLSVILFVDHSKRALRNHFPNKDSPKQPCLEVHHVIQ